MNEPNASTPNQVPVYLLLPAVKPPTTEPEAFHAGISHHRAFVASSGLGRLLGLLNLPNGEVKSLLNIVVQSSTGFGKRAVKLFFQLPAFIERDLPLLRLQVALVSHHNQWY